MISLGGVPSALIARNESWVRKEASSLARRLPSNVEKADLIQVGLIAVAHASLLFDWEGDPESEAGKAAFVGYARLRVKGAMLDELRQIDHLQREDRRRVKVLQIARDRWRSVNGGAATLTELSGVSSLSIDEIARLDEISGSLQSDDRGDDVDSEDFYRPTEAATEADEVEARVDTAIVLRRLEKYFATLPERDRDVIDAYMGIGLTPIALARAMRVTPSRVAQLYKAIVTKVARHFGNELPTGDRRRVSAATLDQQVAAREARAFKDGDGHWGVLIEQALTGRPGTHCKNHRASRQKPA
jgi:RNA polymerase sigma factor for flagellar operon FliA